MKLKTVGISLLAAALFGLPLCGMSSVAMAETNVMQQDGGVVKGVVKDGNGEPVFGAIVFVVGTTNSCQVDFDGNYKLDLVKKGATIRAQMMGYNTVDQVWNGGTLNFTLQEETAQLEELVVTAMGIMRKEKSLTYATQQIKAAELLQVQDVNLVNSLEGKISGITITPSAGGAGGASKILLRGNKSIMGDNAPLIVVDGIPMTNGIRGQQNSAETMYAEGVAEGSDPLSMINPDDIESMNILKGANAAALYGSRAANGVVMITTKKGKQGKMEVTFNSNTTFETPLLTPDIQNTYGAAKYDADGNITSLSLRSWGDRMQGGGSHVVSMPNSTEYFAEGMRDVYLRGSGADDIDDFFSTGITTNNSISISGGTEKIQTYVSYSNSYSKGMIETNKYTRNTFAFRQTYKLWDRLTVNVSANYMQTKTNNRVGGGRLFNPLYDLYLSARDVDMGHYKGNYVADGTWKSSNDTQKYWAIDPYSGSYKQQVGHAMLIGPVQQWAYQSPMSNNPYWLTNQNFSENREDRFFGSFQANLKIIEGLHLQARVSIDHSKYNSESGRYATTMSTTDMERYGGYWLTNERTNEIYTDYLLSYNKQFGDDWSLSATAGYVGHTTSGTSYVFNNGATTVVNYVNGMMTSIPTQVNIFNPYDSAQASQYKSESSNWDQAALATAQVGWKDMIFVDLSYRQDWYRPFRQFKHLGTDESYGYFGFGGNAVLSEIFKLPKWVSYAKYRLSYSEVGNSIPNTVFNSAYINLVNDAISTNGYAAFRPEPETTKSFETGLELQLLNDRLNVDITYYNSAMHNSYLTASLLSGKTLPVNSGVIRNQGVELTVGYDWMINKDWRWKTSANFSYNHNEIEEIYNDPKTGESATLASTMAEGKIQILYKKGGKYGDMYITDLKRHEADVFDANNNLIHKKGDLYLTDAGELQRSSETYGKYIGNMNSKYQLSWSNTITYKDFSLYFLINGRIGGKIVSITESFLDRYGVSQRTADARNYAENWVDPETGEKGLYAADGSLGMFINEGRDIVSIEKYYDRMSTMGIEDYVYDATNFRLRELSLGYTFRNLFGEYKNLSLSFVCRNLFFIYKDSPVDPDISLSTGNGLGGFDIFNMPSARSYGFNLKLNL